MHPGNLLSLIARAFLPGAAALAVLLSGCKDTTPPLVDDPEEDLDPAVVGAVLVGTGDIHAACGDPRMEATAKLLDEIPGTVFTVGDNVAPDSGRSEYHDCYEPTWGRHKERTFATLGNWDYHTGNAEAAFDYFGDRLGPPGLGYYSYDLDNWRIIVLNSNGQYVPIREGSEQDQWLVADLEASAGKCILAMWHHPRFFSSTQQGWTEAPGYRIFWERLHAAGAHVVVNAHQHFYERFAPQDPDGNPDEGGLRQFIVGTGGAQMWTPSEVAPNSEVRSATRGVLKFTLGEGTYAWQFIPVAGQTFTDSGTGTCR